jgi:hypothetical protein
MMIWRNLSPRTVAALIGGKSKAPSATRIRRADTESDGVLDDRLAPTSSSAAPGKPAERR